MHIAKEIPLLPAAKAAACLDPSWSPGRLVTCPACSGKMHVTQHAFICESDACPDRVVTPIEMLQRRVSKQSAEDRILRVYGDALPPGEKVADIVAASDFRSRVRNFFHSAYERSLLRHPELAQGAAWARSLFPQGLVGLHRKACLVTSREMQMLFRQCRIWTEVPAHPLTGRFYLVWPVYGTPADIIGFYFRHPGCPDTYVPLDTTYALGYSGVFANPVHPELVVVRSKDKLSERGPGVLLSSLTGDKCSVWPTSLWLAPWKFQASSAATLSAVSKFLYAGGQLDYRYDYQKARAQNFERDLFRFLAATSCKREFDEIISQFKLPSNVVGRLASFLVDQGKPEEALALEFITDNDKGFLAQTGVRFVRGREGYLAFKKSGNRDAPTKISNFSLEFKAFAHCLTGQESFIEAEAVHPSGTRTVHLLDKYLEKPREIERVVKNAFSDLETASMPTIFEASLFKQMLPWFQLDKSKATYCRGVSRLGWSSDRLIYQGASWHVGYQGTVDTVTSVRHPVEPALANFDFGRGGGVEQLPETTDFASLVSLCVAWVAREFTGYPIKSIPVTGDTKLLPALTKFFSALGQNRLIPVSSNLRDNPYACFRGFPFLSVTQDPRIAGEVKAPTVIMTTKGIRLDSNIEDPGLAGRFLAGVLQRTAAWLLATQGSEFRKQQALTYADELMLEGDIILGQKLGLRNWPATGRIFKDLERFIQGIGTDKTKDWFTLDFLKQEVLIKKHPKIDILGDLTALCARVEDTGKNYRVDALSASALLEQYFDAVPEMTVQENVS